MNKTVVIGITGGIGGGKSMFSRYLMRRGEMVYDADLEARILQNHDEELIAAIKKEFGDQIYNEFGLDRAELAKIVFPNPERLRQLTAMVHPAVKKDFASWKERNSNRKFLFMENAVLFEGGFESLVDKVLVVTAPEKVRIERVMRRDCVTEEKVRDRIKNQLPETDKVSRGDWVFDTNNMESPHLRVDAFLGELYRSL